MIWSLLFDTMLLFYASSGTYGLFLLLNMIFQCFYTCSFNRRRVPKDKIEKFKKGRITKAQMKHFVEPVDMKFNRYMTKHSCVSCTIAIFTVMCSFKCNKIYYSRLYSFDMFKAQWSQGSYYRKSMTIFCVVGIILDALLICVCLASLSTREPFSNMLWITTVEVLILSLMLIILAGIELCMLKDYLSYNEPQKMTAWAMTNSRQKFEVSAVPGGGSDMIDLSARELLMKHLIRNIKGN